MREYRPGARSDAIAMLWHAQKDETGNLYVLVIALDL